MQTILFAYNPTSIVKFKILMCFRIEARMTINGLDHSEINTNFAFLSFGHLRF